MVKIKGLDLSRLHTEEDFGFHKSVLQETSLLTQEADKQVVADYTAAIAAFDGALEADSTKELTAAVSEVDGKADTAWRGINGQVKVLLSYPKEEVRVLAEKASVIVKKYGDITGLSYNEEYGNMYNLLQDLDSFGVENQKKVYIHDWVAELHAQYEAFMKASSERTAAESMKVTGIVKTTRTACDEAYRVLAEKVNALALVMGEENYAEFINRVNVIIDKAKSTLSARSSNAKKKDG